MPLAVQCPQCGKQFNPKPELAGKRVKCSQCGGVISIPGGAPAPKPAPAASAAATARPASRRGAAPPQAFAGQGYPPAPMARGGVADILDDANVGELVSMPVLRPGESMCPNCRAAVPMGGAMCVKCGFDFRAGKVYRTVTPKPVDPRVKQTLGAIAALAVVLVGIGITIALAVSVPLVWRSFELEKVDIAWKNYGISAMVLGGSLSLLFNASILADAFKEGPWRGVMYLFVPGYWIYFICTRWKTSWRPFFAALAATWLLFTGAFVFQVGKQIEDSKTPEVKTQY